jgi:hypothetical protein
MPSKPTAFISYAREDYDTALELFEYLESIGVEPWMDKKRLIGGEDWDRAINRAVRECDFFLFCASPQSVNKRGAVQREIKLALDLWREKLEDDIYFIPVRLKQCDLPKSISRFQWIDYFEEDARTRIQHSIATGTQRHQTEPTVLPLEIHTRTLRNENEGKWYVNFAYPEFLPADAVGIPEVNSVLSVFANRARSRFVTQFGETDFHDERMPYFLDVSYSVTLVSYHLISVRFDEGIYTGGAHPNYHTRTFNFIRDPWYEFDIDYLPADKKYTEFFKGLSGLCVEDISQQRLRSDPAWTESRLPQVGAVQTDQDSWLRTGAGPDSKNFANFCIDPDCFTFVFDPYQVGSYAEGRSVVRIPITLLAGYLRPDLVARLHE